MEVDSRERRILEWVRLAENEMKALRDNGSLPDIELNSEAFSVSNLVQHAFYSERDVTRAVHMVEMIVYYDTCIVGFAMDMEYCYLYALAVMDPLEMPLSTAYDPPLFLEYLSLEAADLSIVPIDGGEGYQGNATVILDGVYPLAMNFYQSPLLIRYGFDIFDFYGLMQF